MSTAKPPPPGCGDEEEIQDSTMDVGLPDPATILSEQTLTSPKGHQYRVLRTSQTDDDEADERPPASKRHAGRHRPRPKPT